MPDKILHKRSLTTGSIPTTGSMDVGELAINVPDGKIYIRRSGSSGDIIVPLVTANTITTGSIQVTAGFTGSLQGTASYVTGSIFTSANRALSASYAVTASYFSGSITNAISSSYAVTASYAMNGGGGSTSPAGALGQIQYNSGSVFGADSSFKFIISSQSLQQGLTVLANGGYSHAEGFDTRANDSYSHAEGYGTIAGNFASHAEGYATQTAGGYSHAEGYSTLTNGSFSHAEGESTTATGLASHAEGYGTLANGQYSHVEGTSRVIYPTPQVDINALTSVTINGITYNSLFSSNVNDITINGNVTGDFPSLPVTITDLIVTDASGRVVVNLNYYTQPVVQSAAYEGGNNTTIITITDLQSSYQLVEEASLTATANYSHAEGFGTTTGGVASHAEGYQTIASGSFSHAEGKGTYAQGDYQHVQGLFNATSSISGAFIHGNGTSDSNRSNLIFAYGSVVEITGSLRVSSITGSLQGTASFATSASFVTGSVFTSSNRALSASFAVTASYALSSPGGTADTTVIEAQAWFLI